MKSGNLRTISCESVEVVTSAGMTAMVYSRVGTGRDEVQERSRARRESVSHRSKQRGRPGLIYEDGVIRSDREAGKAAVLFCE